MAEPIIAFPQTPQRNVLLAEPPNLVAITPSDSARLAIPIRRLYIGGGANVTISTPGGQCVTLYALQVGVFHWVRATQVWATGSGTVNGVTGNGVATSGTNIVGGY